MKLPKFFQKAPPDGSAFWEWFAKFEGQIREVRTGQEPIMAALSNKLKQVDHQLEFEMSVNPTGDREFIVSAGGIDVIPAVEVMVKQAPAIPGWKIIAFRQRKSCDTIVVNGHPCQPKDYWFEADRHREHLDLELYSKDFGLPDQAGEQAAFLFLDSILGEYDVMTKVGAIDFYQMPADPAAQDLKPILELAAIVDSI